MNPWQGWAGTVIAALIGALIGIAAFRRFGSGWAGRTVGADMTRSDWLSTMALLASLVAIAFSGLQWREAKMQREAQFDSALVFDLETELPQRAGLAVRNVGPGVARLNSVTYYLDGRILDGPSDALEAVKLDPDKDEGVTLDRGDSMAAGEVDWLIRYPIKRKSDEDKARELLEDRLQIAVDYCSANSRCASKCSRHGGCPKPAP